MKNRILAIFSCVVLLNCNDSGEQIRNNTHSNKSKILNSKKIKPKQTDEKFISTPKWVLTEIQNTRKKLSWMDSVKMVEYIEINDSLQYLVYEFMDGVCYGKTLKTFFCKNKVDSIELELSCDHDMSITENNWKSYAFISDKEFKIVEYKEYVNDTLKNEDGSLKEGLDFLEVETSTDTTYSYYKINKRGFVKMF